MSLCLRLLVGIYSQDLRSSMVCCLDAVGLLPLISAVIPAFIIVVTLVTVKSLLFAHINLNITSDNYSLTRKGISWKSFLQIIYVPSHCNDLESEQFVETSPKESHYVRHAALRAEVRSLIPVYYLTSSDVDCDSWH